MAARALIVGLAGPRLKDEEREFLSAARPWGAIIFTRNIENPIQLLGIVGEIRESIPHPEAPVLVDQEGGRVQRLGPPGWPAYPAARRIGALHRRDAAAGLEAAGLIGRLIAADLRDVGINVACLPVLDLDLPGADQIIGDRSYGADPVDVAALGRAVAEGLAEGGCMPVIKHVPGHGRAACDSHLALPRVDASAEELGATDFVPFRALRDLPAAMTAHVLYTSIDAERPATVSPRIISEVIRGEIGFGGLLMSDDLSMGALSGPVAARGADAIAAGCDIALHCNGDMAEMRALAQCVPLLEGAAAERAEAALGRIGSPDAFDVASGRRQLDRLMAAIA